MYTPSQIARTVTATATAFDALAVQIARSAGSKPEQVQRVRDVAEDLFAAAHALAIADNAAEALPVIERVEADITAVLAIGYTLPLTPQGGNVLWVATMLLPILTAAARRAWPPA